MNKQNKILLGILAFIVACTIGYALFSESITISGTASASGKFEIKTYCTIGLENNVLKEGLEYMMGEDIVESGTRNDSCIVSGNTVSINTDLLYPTATRYYVIEIKNTGEIPIVSSQNDMIESITTNKYDSETNAFISQMPSINDLYTSSWFGFKDAQGTIISPFLSDYSNFLIMDNPDDPKLILRPNESLYMYILAEWRNTSEEEENGVYYSTEYELSYDFIQAQ